MIKKLQHRFILITMSCIGFIFLLVLLILNFSMTAASRNRGFHLLAEHIQKKNTSKPHAGRHLPPDETPPGFIEGHRPNDWFNDMRIFSVTYNSSGEVSEVSTNNNPNLSESSLLSLADAILKKPKDKGIISGYLYLYIPSEEGISIYFLDYAPEREMSMQLWSICLWVGLAGMLIILIPVIFLSRWIAKPVQLAFDRQKQFIADASHELKTPLTIITTNAEVLENTLPDNKWLNYILEQSGRMKIRKTALSFESLAYEHEKKYVQDIANGLSFYGNEENIKQLVTILLDNAFKYSDINGRITITLTQSAEKKRLLVHNTGKGIDIKDQKHIFERFYRIDNSRSRQSGGYGLGLAIAQSIVEKHNGHIGVKSDGQNFTEFWVLLP